MGIELTFVSLHYQALVHHRRTQIIGALSEHFIGKKACTIAIMDD